MTSFPKINGGIMQGLIIENISNLYKIEAEDKQIYEATARGKFNRSAR